MNRNTLFLVAVLVLLIGVSASAQHYTDWTEFEYTEPTDEVDFYILERDYTISLPSYFTNPDNLHWRYRGYTDYLRNWAQALPPCDWDFVRIDYGGILTIKKGFRWDGASLPGWRDLGDFTVRSSMVHDALYNLMRLKYLAADHNHYVWCIDKQTQRTDGDFNRLLADQMIFMIAVEDGQNKTGIPGANNDNRILRRYAACRTHNTNYLYDFQPHVSELTAYASDGKVELQWKPANQSGAWPRFEGDFSPYHGLVIERSDGQTFTLVPALAYTSFIDEDVVNGEVYGYQIVPHANNGNQLDWSHQDIVVPRAGAGNALQFDGVNDYVEANTVANDIRPSYGPLPFGPLTMEAWVYPEDSTGRMAIMAFNSQHGFRSTALYYNGDDHTFSYYDVDIEISTTDEFPADNWYHVAATIDMFNRGVLFINGEEQATFGTSVRPDWGSRFSIGQEWNIGTTTQHFKGMMDEVRIWSKARTQAQILADWCHPLLGNEDGLVGLWHFDEPEVFHIAHDATSNASDGRLMGYGTEDLTFTSSEAMDAECGPAVIDTTEVVAVEIDIKPGSCPNPLNAKEKKGHGRGGSNAVLPVAIPGTDEFDVNDIVPSAIMLEGVAPVRWSYEDVSTPVDKAEDECACSEDGGDGHDDLTLKFKRDEIIQAILAGSLSGTVIDSTDGQTVRTLVRLTLTAKLEDGTDITGHDCVVLMTRVGELGENDDDERGRPQHVTLIGNHPNPFNPSTNISLFAPSTTTVRLEVFNMLGQKVKTLLDGPAQAGNHTIEWDASGFASGIYLYRLEAGDYVESKKMLLLK